ncbi:thiamine phosphate synthase [Lysinibacillus sp. NPDC097287]|uniref:thiamine phosphate synthase n=1 Tax=Lysinibacillus sp. NPDC097287 TaxID=3364144 RepID=UPI003805E9F2
MKRENLQLYFIMGSDNAKQREPLAILEEALQAGITMFQFREKGLNAFTGYTYEKFARDCQKLCQQYHVPFIINDDVDLAIKLNANGIHIGQDDLHISIVREKIGNMLLGISVHSDAELQVALQYGADYVGIGPIFATRSKHDANAPSGTAFLQKVRSQHPELPIVAIGGIDNSNAHTVIEAGSDGVAVISAISESNDIQHTVVNFKKTFHS